jgi:hypothetical protein
LTKGYQSYYREDATIMLGFVKSRLVERTILHSIHSHSLPNKFLNPPDRHPDGHKRE